MKVRTFYGQEFEMQRDEIGLLPNGDSVVVCTDAAGPQIIISGPETHLLSSSFKSHEEACDAAKCILVDGEYKSAPGCNWTDLRKGGLVDGLMAVFMAPFMRPLQGDEPVTFPVDIEQHKTGDIGLSGHQ